MLKVVVPYRIVIRVRVVRDNRRPSTPCESRPNSTIAAKNGQFGPALGPLAAWAR